MNDDNVIIIRFIVARNTRRINNTLIKVFDICVGDTI